MKAHRKQPHKLASSLSRPLILALGLLLTLAGLQPAEAYIEGLTGTSFNFTAKADTISTADGNTVAIWGYANGGGRAQYPGPTLIVNQGDRVSITLTNQLPIPVSIVFPGHQVTVTGGTPGILTREAPPDGATSVTYTFTTNQPGTYTYYSGSRPDLQVEMGLFGAIIVRPAGFDLNDPAKRTAYGHPDTAFAREYLAVLSDMDYSIHEKVSLGRFDQADTTAFKPVYWFISGRTGPDTMDKAFAEWLPTQPYNCAPRMHPREKILLRIVGAGRDLHPFHTHGSHLRVIARDGRMLSSGPGKGPDLSQLLFTTTSAPGQTVDGIFEFPGDKFNWDIYGTGPENDHTCNGKSVTLGYPAAASDGYDPVTGEYCPDHGKPLPTSIRSVEEFTAGPWFSGGPYLGSSIALPPGEGGLNPTFGFMFMWHSHNENELINFNIFPGGMLTMFIVESRRVVTLSPLD